MFALFVAALLSGIPAKTPHDAFVSVNGVRLHYVDWGGGGQTILFLIGGGNGSAHTFDSFAPRFTDRFRVLGLTRRGQGPSAKSTQGTTPIHLRTISMAFWMRSGLVV